MGAGVRKKWFIQEPAALEVGGGGSHPKDHLNILEQAKGFIRRERENRTKRLIEEG